MRPSRSCTPTLRCLSLFTPVLSPATGQAHRHTSVVKSLAHGALSSLHETDTEAHDADLQSLCTHSEREKRNRTRERQAGGAQNTTRKRDEKARELREVGGARVERIRQAMREGGWKRGAGNIQRGHKATSAKRCVCVCVRGGRRRKKEEEGGRRGQTRAESVNAKQKKKEKDKRGDTRTPTQGNA